MATLIAFHETKNLFIEATNYSQPLSFEEWSQAPEGLQAAILFVQFYDSIASAWSKANAYDFIPGEDGVSTCLQYLQKNVPIIRENPKRFNGKYIYRVAYNCMYCICHDLKCVKDRWENEIPNITASSDGDELDLFDTVVSFTNSADCVFDQTEFEKEFWSIIEDCGVETEKAVRYLLSGDPATLRKLSKTNKNYEADPLRDVAVSLDAIDSIVADLRVKLAKFAY